LPKCIDDYIHRIGRTARAGKYGTSITFVIKTDDKKLLKNMVGLLKQANQKIPRELTDLV